MLSGLIAWSGEGENQPALRAGELGDDVPGGAEPVQTEALARTGGTERPPAD